MPLNDLDAAQWLNEPPEWSLAATALTMTTGDKTDFWQGTYYGFHRDDGHALLLDGGASFTASVTFEGAYKHLYDQAGLMLRVDATRWIKIGIEYTDGETNFSIVVTDGRSDWSVVRSPGAAGPQTVRLTLSDDAALGQFRNNEGEWTLMRLAPFTRADQVSVGPMACSPERSGFKVNFSDFTLSAPLKDALHG